jgi:hypothetical protein
MVDGGILHEGLESEGTGTQGRIRCPARRSRRDYSVGLNLCHGLTGVVQNRLLTMTNPCWVTRSEIASCHEKAYATLPLADATRLLFFKNESETVEFGQGVSWRDVPLCTLSEGLSHSDE